MELVLAVANNKPTTQWGVRFFQYGGTEKLSDVVRPLQKAFSEPTAIFVKRVDDANGLQEWVD